MNIILKGPWLTGKLLVLLNKGRNVPQSHPTCVYLPLQCLSCLHEYFGMNGGICYLLVAWLAAILREQLKSAFLILQNSYVLFMFR